MYIGIEGVTLHTHMLVRTNELTRQFTKMDYISFDIMLDFILKPIDIN